MSPRRSVLLALLKLADIIVVAGCLAFSVPAAVTHVGSGRWFASLEMRVSVGNVLFGAGYLLFWHLVLETRGLYRSYRLAPVSRELRDVARINERWHHRRFSVKPGITYFWQVIRREPKCDEWVSSDMECIDNWSLGLDLKILVRTILAVLSGHGAH